MRSVADFDFSRALLVQLLPLALLGGVSCNDTTQEHDDHTNGGNSASAGSAGANPGNAGQTSGGVVSGGTASGGASTGGHGGVATGGSASAGRSSTSGGSASGGNAGGGGTNAAGGTMTGGTANTGGAPSMVDETVAWVLSYFGPEQSVAADSLHLAYSTDGLHWTRLGSGSPAYQLTGIGTNHIRDPFILRKHDGSFVFIATDWTLSNDDSNYWNNPSSKILVAASQDLITFSDPHLLTLTTSKGAGGKAMHAWAPEAYYDAAADQYAIIWSGNDSADRNRIYISYTKDFKTTTSAEPQVLFDPGYSVIDGTVTTWNGASYLFFKDETDNSGGSLTGSGKDIQVAKSSSAAL
ncbi:MAG TPA: hypothetical protein VEQ58_05960, partial [Polyangiaceae bacterium]|nr:hypothetical protein [Polyangiaceae bacterium]